MDYGGKLHDYNLDVTQLNTSDPEALSGHILDTAAALEERIDELLNRRDTQGDRPRRKSVCGFMTKLYPLATILLDLGSSAAQVPSDLKQTSGCVTTKRSAPARKPAVKELRPETSRQEADRLGLCRHCKEAGHFRRDCPKLQQSRQQPASNAISLISSEMMRIAFHQIRLSTVNKVRQGYVVKDTRSYRDAVLEKPKLEASVDKRKIAMSTGHHQNLSRASTSKA